MSRSCLPALAFMIFLQAGCEKDILENYRRDYCGIYAFTTIREDMTVIPAEIIDTIYYFGAIDAVYSNRRDLVRIDFAPGIALHAIVSTDGHLSLPDTGPAGNTETLTGIFTNSNTWVVFHYTIRSGSSYSVFHRVEGIRY